MKIVLFIIRYLFVLIYLTTSLGKLLDNRGFAQAITAYQLPGLGQMNGFVLSFALAFSLFELFLAYALTTGKKLLVTAYAVLAVQLMYLVLALVTLYRGITIDNCGCFGVFLQRPLTTATVYEDLLLLIMAIAQALLIKKYHQHQKAAL
ncbi:MAG TPA: hypothetical protein PKC21_09565 [Oligoflexia bacterium]|nr:hypothetical protein [Oligoflexia bacterium]HMR25585.1 hypothetical protein [Oligoflexia bacterium]